MLKYYLISALFLFTLSAQSAAQPANDECVDAIELTDLDNNCESYDYANASDDAIEGSCEPNGSGGIWFSFEAQGPDLSLEAEVEGSQIPYISVFQFDGAACNANDFEEIACGVESIAEDDLLTSEETYYIKLSADPAGFSSIGLCITNPIVMDPPNDGPCFANELPADSSCVLGTTDNATFDEDNPECIEPSESSVWYKFTLSPNNTIVDLSVENLNIAGPITAMLVQFDDPDCMAESTYITGSGVCDTSEIIEWTVEELDDEEEYYLQIASAQADTGDFRVCVEERIPEPECDAYNPCSEAYSLNVPPATFPTFFTACNTGSEEGPTDMPGGCFYMENPTEWFSLELNQNTSVLRILAESEEIEKIQMAIYKGNDCNSLEGVTCLLEEEDGIDLLLENIDNDATYFIAITGLLGTTGFFDIGIHQIVDESDCTLSKDLTVTNTSFGSPPGGPYQSGEKVSFCYEIALYDPVNCNYLQGIVPSFGNGWDPSSFQMNGSPELVDMPLQNVSPGSWDWYESGEVEYNLNNPAKGYTTGSPMPAGWYFTRPTPSDPDNSRGDGILCEQNSIYTWKVCFTLTALNFPQCDDQSVDFDCDVRIQTFSDSELGTHPDEGCLNDVAALHTANLECCESPGLELNDTTTCVGQEFIKVFEDTTGITQEFTWEVIDNDGVLGVESGQDDTLTANYQYEGFGPREVVYEVSVADTGGCNSPSQIWTVTVYPTLFADAGNVDSVCEGTTLILGGNPTAAGGKQPYTYDWSHGIPGNSNPQATIDTEDTYTVTVTDDAGCRATDGEFIAHYPTPTATISGDQTICPGETAFIQIDLTGVPNYRYTLSINGEEQSPTFISQSSFTLEFNPTENTIYELVSAQDDRCPADISGVAIVNVREPTTTEIEETICAGESIDIGDETFDESGEYEVVFEGQGSGNCDSIVQLNLNVLSPILLQDTTIVADDGTGSGAIFPDFVGSQPPYDYLWNTGATTENLEGVSSDTYTVTVTDGAGCTEEFSFFVDMEVAVESIRGGELSGISMYPNPLDGGTLYFEWKAPRDHFLRIIDYRGKTVFEQSMNGEKRVDLSWPDRLPSGLYFIRIQTDEHQGYFPLIYHR